MTNVDCRLHLRLKLPSARAEEVAIVSLTIPRAVASSSCMGKEIVRSLTANRKGFYRLQKTTESR